MTINKRNDQKTKKPWPTKEAMVQVYKKKLWGDNKSVFYSGEGSHHPKIVAPYVTVLRSFLTSFDHLLTVCDLGCGDFNIGKQLVQYTQKYIAVDIVPELIAHNKAQFNATNLEFYCLDIAVDDLPSGDCALVRQVLQHISNAEILKICKKLRQFKYVILTEHLPEGDFIPNKAIISGQGTRMKKNSGLHLLEPPFNMQVKEEQELLSVVLGDGRGVIVTSLYMMY